MKKGFLLILYALTSTTCAFAQSADSLGATNDTATLHQLYPEWKSAIGHKPKSISIKYDQGEALKTNDFLKKDDIDLGYHAMALKFSLGLAGDDWQREIYHRPYTGIGFYTASFNESEHYGHPMSFFLFHGGSLANFSRHCHLQYEWNLGYSFGWKHWDEIKDPENITIGSTENAHVSFNLFLEWQLLRNLDLKIGGGFTHFSNGATHLPNKGMNLWSPMVELAYRWDDPWYEWTKAKIDTATLHQLYPQMAKRPEFKRHLKHEITFTVSKRQLYMDTIGSGLPNENYDHTFRVFQLSYAPLYCPRYKFAYGPSIDLVYDESNNAYVRPEKGSDGLTYEHLHLGKFGDRIQLGISAKGEMRTPLFTYFGQLGYDITHAVKETSRFYQIVGVEAYLNKHLYGTCGIRAIRLSKAQFIYWSLGYAFDSKTPWQPKDTVVF